MTRISIAMGTFNGAAHLREQLSSLAAQSHLPHELCVGDDGSTDETPAILAQFAADAPFPVHVTCNATNLGFGGNFIATARRCGGDWIAFADQDDVWQPDKLEWAERQIAAGPGDLALIAHDAIVTDAALMPVRRLYSYPAEERSGPLGLPPEWFCIGVTQVFRADLVHAVPSDRRVSFPWHDHRDAHDVWIALLANCLGTVLRSSHAPLLYRRHGGTVTDQAKQQERRDLVHFQGPNYLARADYLDGVSALLAQLAPQSAAEFAERLAAASEAIGHHAGLLRLRGRALTERGVRRRLGALAAALRAGAYGPAYRWSFGMARLVKDIAGVLLSPPLPDEAPAR